MLLLLQIYIFFTLIIHHLTAFVRCKTWHIVVIYFKLYFPWYLHSLFWFTEEQVWHMAKKRTCIPKQKLHVQILQSKKVIKFTFFSMQLTMEQQPYFLFPHRSGSWHSISAHTQENHSKTGKLPAPKCSIASLERHDKCMTKATQFIENTFFRELLRYFVLNSTDVQQNIDTSEKCYLHKAKKVETK